MSAEPQHDAGCIEWCNHCQVCGAGIMYGSRCPAHYLSTDRENGSED